MVTEADRQLMWQLYAPNPRMRLNLGIRRRLAPLLDNDRRKIELANAILFSLPGAPIIYYGDEIGMGDNIQLFDRNGVRTPMQWAAQPGAGFSQADPSVFWTPLLDDDIFGYQRLNVAQQLNDPHSLLHTMRRLIAVRRANPVLGEGDCQFLPTGNQAVLAFLRQTPTTAILALYNLSEQPQTLSLNLAEFAGRSSQDLLGQPSPLPAINAGPNAVTLISFAYHWLQIK